MNRVRMRLILNGVVQGVGMRPSIYRLATKIGLGGYVKNTSSGVVIEVEGGKDMVDRFCKSIYEYLPENATLKDVYSSMLPPAGYGDFYIDLSSDAKNKSITIPADLALCQQCKSEFRNPSNRRYLYPFINCTACGPRFSIIQSIPYDRVNTTMSVFKMCAECSQEYRNPSNRRFHAEPIACERCGPYVWFVSGSKKYTLDAVTRAIEFLLEGRIIAIKGLGGFHIACLPEKNVVDRLRKIKSRDAKPFAVMVKNISIAESICYVDEKARDILLSRRAPIVILKSKRADILEAVAPGLNEIGIMLPYTPLHELIFEKIPILIMTSANFKDEPVCIDNSKIMDIQLDGYLLHNRDIANRVDDSVMRHDGITIIIRRARGFVPEPVSINSRARDIILATGAELKNTFTILKEGDAYISQHIGDLSDAKAFEFFVEAIEKFKKLLGVEIDVVAHDMHPDYISTIWAKNTGKKLIQVQHHIAHIGSVIAEEGLEGDVVGVAFDGTGYGMDGSIWGGEFFVYESNTFRRVAHLKPFKLIGGERSIKEIWRIAFSILAGIEPHHAIKFIPPELRRYENVFFKMLENEKMLTTSMGRLFDAVSAISGIRNTVDYEAQAAMELEAISSIEYGLNFDIFEDGGMYVIDWEPVIKGILRASNKNLAGSMFHGACVNMVVDVVKKISSTNKIKDVVLSGGCFQNMILLKNVVNILKNSGYNVYYNKRTPLNDGNISLGQVWYASKILECA